MDVTVTTREGESSTITGRLGLTLMQAIRNAGFDELEAMCGGSLSCATCHVYVDSVPSGVDLPEQSQDEMDLLEASDHLAENSRLSCQIPVDDQLDGLAVTIAPED